MGCGSARLSAGLINRNGGTFRSLERELAEFFRYFILAIDRKKLRADSDDHHADIEGVRFKNTEQTVIAPHRMRANQRFDDSLSLRGKQIADDGALIRRFAVVHTL